MNQKAPLTLLRTRVAREWIDHNGHLNDAWYCVLFSRAVDVFMEGLGVDDAYRARTGHSMYTLEMHVCYLQEVRVDEALRITGQLLQADTKKTRVFLRMFHEPADELLATSEQLLMHVDRSVPSAAPFPPRIAERVDALVERQRDLPWPRRAGGGIALRRGHKDPDSDY